MGTGNRYDRLGHQELRRRRRICGDSPTAAGATGPGGLAARAPRGRLAATAGFLHRAGLLRPGLRLWHSPLPLDLLAARHRPAPFAFPLGLAVEPVCGGAERGRGRLYVSPAGGWSCRWQTYISSAAAILPGGGNLARR